MVMHEIWYLPSLLTCIRMFFMFLKHCLLIHFKLIYVFVNILISSVHLELPFNEGGICILGNLVSRLCVVVLLFLLTYLKVETGSGYPGNCKREADS